MERCSLHGSLLVSDFWKEALSRMLATLPVDRCDANDPLRKANSPLTIDLQEEDGASEKSEAFGDGKWSTI